jgi:hypothetical protein
LAVSAELVSSSKETQITMKKISYLLGVVSGVVITNYWRVLVKQGVKAGVRAGRAVREVSQQAMEDVQDASAEALEELGPERRKEGR